MRNSKGFKFQGDGFLEYQAVVRGPVVVTLKLAYEVHIRVVVSPVVVLKQVRFAMGEEEILEVEEVLGEQKYIAAHLGILPSVQEDRSFELP